MVVIVDAAATTAGVVRCAVTGAVHVVHCVRVVVVVRAAVIIVTRVHTPVRILQRVRELQIDVPGVRIRIGVPNDYSTNERNGI